MATARKGENAGAAVVDGATLAAVLDRHRYLSAEQVADGQPPDHGRRADRRVAALPGTGKTTALAAAREAGRRRDPGVGVATARSASGELEDDAGVPATSITAL